MIAPKTLPGPTQLSRRTLLLTLSLAALGAASGLQPMSALAQRKTGPATVPIEELMKPGALPELSIGDAGAGVVIVEYASLACHLCAEFHNTVFPKLKAKYVDTGNVRFVFRDFPLDNHSAAAALLVRCAGDEKDLELIKNLFKTQDYWAIDDGSQARVRLFDVMEPAGFTRDEFEKCLKNQTLLDSIEAARDRAANEFGIWKTPTFFVNGRRLKGDGTTLGEFDTALQEELKRQG